MNFLELFFSIRKARRAFKLSAWLRESKALDESLRIERMTTQAAAYGYEIGKGKPLKEVLDASKDNPFLDAFWRGKVVKDV